ncbi:ABC transporter permease [Vibrio coralliirubri]|uniref:ABC transporter permease n=1 Tax=Vibrio coralliirubri TaxID=1516159 RepID=UPI00073E287B|nr:ABC transporter permease [Vibrio coralliirubri]
MLKSKFAIDFQQSIKEREFWLTLAWVELKRSYSGTRLGVFWRPLSATIVGLTLGVVYSIILQQPAGEYVPYVITGLVVWTFISQLIIEGGKIFYANASQIKEVPLSYLSYVYKYLIRNSISLLFSFLPVVIVLTYFGHIFDSRIFQTLFGVFLVSLNGFWVSIILGIATLYLKDLTEFTANFMRLVFFITPVLWTPEMAGAKGAIVIYNPLYYYLDIIRSPLIGHDINTHSYLITSSITVVGIVISYFIYNRSRDKISFLV